MVNKKIGTNLTSEVMWNKNSTRYLSDLTYPPCGLNEYDNNTNGYSNSNCNDNNDNNGNTDDKHKNINNGNIHFCNG